MKSFRQIICYFLCVSTLFLTSCNTKKQEKSYDQQSMNFVGTPYENMDMYEIGFEVGKKIKNILNNPDFDTQSIRVNAEFIKKSSIETSKIYAELFSQDVKEQIYKKIRNEVLHQEASKLGIEPSIEEIDDYITMTNKIMTNQQNDASDYIYGYLEGMGITIEEYNEEQKESVYFSKQRDALWSIILKDKEDEILAEAEQRKIPFSDVEKEYFNEYVDRLILNADIEYLDPEIKQIMGTGDIRDH